VWWLLRNASTEHTMRSTYTIKGEVISATSYNQALIAYAAIQRSKQK